MSAFRHAAILSVLLSALLVWRLAAGCLEPLLPSPCFKRFVIDGQTRHSFVLMLNQPFQTIMIVILKSSNMLFARYFTDALPCTGMI